MPSKGHFAFAIRRHTEPAAEASEVPPPPVLPLCRSAELSADPKTEEHCTLEQLRARIAELEQRSMLFLGVWREGKSYQPGDAATHGGSLWVATAPSQDLRPGSSEAWVLAVKKGSAR